MKKYDRFHLKLREGPHLRCFFFFFGVKFAQSVAGSSLDSVQHKSRPIQAKQLSSHLYVTAITL